MTLEFRKMNGAGNDFVVFDARKQEIHLLPQQVLKISARSNPITKGCDQLIVIESPSLTLPLSGGGMGGGADAFMRIYNADSSEVDACGNATRCVAYLLEKELKKSPVTIQTNAGILYGVGKKHVDGKEFIQVDMGAARFDWQDIPLSVSTEQAVKKIMEFCGLQNPMFVSMGNPHVVFFLDKVPSDEVVKELGSKLELYSEIFPKKVNVSFAAIQSTQKIYAKVWERGAGLTKACGTAACAMLAAAHLIDKNIIDITILFEHSNEMVSAKLEANSHILLGGEVVEEFSGMLDL